MRRPYKGAAIVSTICLNYQGPVAWIKMDRQSTLNSWDLESVGEFGCALDACRSQSVRAVVVTGAGRAFSGGGDVNAFAAHLDDTPEEYVRELATRMHERVVLPIRRLPKPVIASINGTAAGGGLSLALACDLRIAADTVKLTFAYSNIGLAADGGSTYNLPRLVGSARAFELLATSEMLDVQRALDLGLVNRVVPATRLRDATQHWAEHLASLPAGSLAAVKALLNSSWSSVFESQLAAEVEAMALLAASEDFNEGVRAFLEKRTPRFG